MSSPRSYLCYLWALCLGGCTVHLVEKSKPSEIAWRAGSLHYRWSAWQCIWHSPDAHLAWALSAPLPLAVYVLLLAGTDADTDQGWKISQKYFTRTLVLAGLGIYVAMAVGAWLTCT